MASNVETKEALGRLSEHHEGSKEEDAIHDKQQRDAEALHDRAPGIPFREVLEAHADEDQRRVKKLMRKIDFRLITILALIYVWAYIDRSNLGNVRIGWQPSPSPLPSPIISWPLLSHRRNVEPETDCCFLHRPISQACVKICKPTSATATPSSP